MITCHLWTLIKTPSKTSKHGHPMKTFLLWNSIQSKMFFFWLFSLLVHREVRIKQSVSVYSNGPRPVQVLHIINCTFKVKASSETLFRSLSQGLKKRAFEISILMLSSKHIIHWVKVQIGAIWQWDVRVLNESEKWKWSEGQRELMSLQFFSMMSLQFFC